MSERADLAEAIVSVGLSKTGATIDAGLAAAAGNGATRAQMPIDGQRRARHGLRRLRTLRRLHRARHQSCGMSRQVGFSWKRAGGTVEMQPAHRHERKIQHCCFERRDRLNVVIL